MDEFFIAICILMGFIFLIFHMGDPNTIRFYKVTIGDKIYQDTNCSVFHGSINCDSRKYLNGVLEEIKLTKDNQ